ncbi:hypothetical protein HAX54_010818 [Datura stramonium]|uniref:Uncharacterized protein n=1 Tax=Datura stramonium TaxID=4076 RepID=A0ABS8RXH1_DATST|nr:hypothetical protein [Datura stramonium]
MDVRSLSGANKTVTYLTQHLMTRADDSYAPSVFAFPKAPLSFKRIHGIPLATTFIFSKIEFLPAYARSITLILGSFILPLTAGDKSEEGEDDVKSSQQLLGASNFFGDMEVMHERNAHNFPLDLGTIEASSTNG